MHASDPVNRLMTAAVLTVDVNDPAGEVLRLFAGYPVHHLPVLDRQKVVGMLSSADVMKLELFLPKGAKSPIEFLNQRMKVGQLVHRSVLTIQAHQSVEAAAQLMAKQGVHSLAVVDAQDHLVGIITTTDIIHAALRSHMESGTAGTQGVSSTESQLIKLSTDQLGHAMTAAATRAGADDDRDFVHQALLQMQARVALLDKLRHVASRYVHAGQDERLHSALCKALEDVDRAEAQGYMEAVKR
jgi:CBS domain-containing membrane protein